MILEPKKIIPLLRIQHGMTVLDIGAGVGFWAKQISPLVGASGKVLALDHNPDITQRLQNDITELGIKNIFPITGDIYEIEKSGITPGVCDKVLLVRMVGYFPDSINEIIERLQKLIKGGGEIIIIDTVSHMFYIKKHIQNSFQYKEIEIVKEKTLGSYQALRIIF